MNSENLLEPALLAEAELLRCLSSVESRNVPCAVIKGIPLARLLYSKVDARGVPVDCDLMVRRNDAVLAVDALIEAGYSSPYLPASQSSYSGVWKVVLRKNFDNGISSTVELHLAPFSPWAHPLSERLIWNHMTDFNCQSRNILIPDRELTIVMLACHFAQSGFSNYKILRDLAVAWDLWQHDIDISQQCALVSESRSMAHLDYALVVIDNLINQPLLSTQASYEHQYFLDRTMIHSEIRYSSLTASRRCALMAQLFPHGRNSPTEIDYRGQIYSFLLTPIRESLAQLRRQLLPSRLGLSVALDKPLSTNIDFLQAALKRISRITVKSCGSGPTHS